MSDAPCSSDPKSVSFQLDLLRTQGGHLLDRPLDDGPDRPLGAGVTQ